jgi:hypothetical protein
MKDNQELPIPLSIATGESGNQVKVANGVFYRTFENANLLFDIPIGTTMNSIATSPFFALPSAFNMMKSTDVISFQNDRVKVEKNQNILHNLSILFKLTQTDGTNFRNLRELRCFVVKGDGVTPYDSVLYSYNQPSTGTHDTLLLRGIVSHLKEDILKLAFVISQTVDGNESDTQMTIFRINWDLTSII